MFSRKSLFLFFGLLALLSMACRFSIGGGEVTPEVPTPVPNAQMGPGAPVASPAPAQGLGGGSHPARSFQEAENAVIKIIATGTLASLEEGGETVYNQGWIGSGFIIDPSGLAVTNNHVAAGAATLKVYIAGDIQKEFPARVVAASECMDLAVIQIEGGPFPTYLEWYSGEVTPGMDVYAAGFPGLGDHWQYTLTKGIISKTHESGETSWAYLDYTYLHDARIRGGNSGGPLITPQGQVVGVNYAGSDMNDANLAIPAVLARPVVEQLRQGKPYQWLGINGEALRVELDDGSVFSGIWVASVETGSPADKAGLQGGDILMEVENIAVSLEGTMREYCDVLSSHASTDPIKVKVLRLATGEVLAGTLNGGETLKVVGQIDGGDAGSGGNAGGAVANGDFVTVTDDLQAIGLQVPKAWTAQVDGSPWETSWTKSDGSTYPVKAASLMAAPNLDAFESLDGPGVWLVASRDFGRIGGYAQLLEGVRHWFQGCQMYEQGDYSDTVYEGQYQIWERCGQAQQITSVVVAARPKANPTAFLTLVIVNVGPNDDAESVIGTIMDTFDVIGNLP